jgi:hypothetical protein
LKAELSKALDAFKESFKANLAANVPEAAAAR